MLRVGLVSAVLLLAVPTWAQPAARLPERVLILVNDSTPRESGTGSQGASVFVGEYYAQKRGIPPQQILHLRIQPSESITGAEYQDAIQRPVRKYLDANDGAMRRRILYIVPTYGVPVRAGFKNNQVLAIDSALAAMYASPVLRLPNPYAQPVGNRPPRFDAWSTQREAAGLWRMFIVSRLDGPSALIAKGLVDKAIAAESTLTRDSGIAYFDYQGDRSPSERQYAIDEEIRRASELSRSQGFRTVVNVQRDAPCRAMIAPAAAYVYQKNGKHVYVNAFGTETSTSFVFKPMKDGEVTVKLRSVAIDNPGSQVLLTLGAADPTTYLRLTYPLVPFAQWRASDKIVLEKVVSGAAAGRVEVPVDKTMEQAINAVTELRIALRPSGVEVLRNGSVILTDPSPVGLDVSRVSLGARCWSYLLGGLVVTDASGATIWNDSFAADTTKQYTWELPPVRGVDALWVWGWYGTATDSYRFVTGAIGAQLTSYTANAIRTPQDADPRLSSVGAHRWGGNWVPRMLEEGVTATWGAVEEPYAEYYAPGGNVFDHFWADTTSARASTSPRTS